MAGAVIVIDQPTGAGSGSPGVARKDLWQAQQINLVDGAGGNTTWAWSLLDKPPGSAATLSGEATSTASFTPDLTGTYRVQLITNGGGPGNVQIKVMRVRFDSGGVMADRGWALPALNEIDGENNFPSNTRSWDEAFRFIFADISATFDGGLPTSGSVSGDLGGTLPSPTVVGLTNVTSDLTFNQASAADITPATNQHLKLHSNGGSSYIFLDAIKFQNQGFEVASGGITMTAPSGGFIRQTVNSNAVLTATETLLTVGSDVSVMFTESSAAPSIYQQDFSTTGANPGADLLIAAQNGQTQTGVNDNNNGGSILLQAGSFGVGGSGADGSYGSVKMQGASVQFLFEATTSVAWLLDPAVFVLGIFAATTATAGIMHAQRSGVGASASGKFIVQAQDGQEQFGANDNNDGGLLLLLPGKAGSGGSGADAVAGGIVFGSDAHYADTGLLRIPNPNDWDGLILVKRNNVDDGNVAIISSNNDDLTFGSSDADDVSLSGGSGKTLRFKLGGTDVMTLTETALTVNVSTSFAFTAPTLQFDPTAGPIITIWQPQLGGTGGSDGSSIIIQAQDGQNQSGVNDNNDGGSIIIATGAPGTGGSGADGLAGDIEFRSGGFPLGAFSLGVGSTAWDINLDTNRLGMRLTAAGLNRYIAVTATNAIYVNTANFYIQDFSGNTVLTFDLDGSGAANTITLNSNVTSFTLAQADKTDNGGTGAPLIIQAQNETGTASEGGELRLKSGSGTNTAQASIGFWSGSTKLGNFHNANNLFNVAIDTALAGYAVLANASNQFFLLQSKNGFGMYFDTPIITWRDATEADTITHSFNATGATTSVIASTVTSFTLSQAKRVGTGANVGATTLIKAQDGQNQTGGNADNDGGKLTLASGGAGTGGTGSPLHGLIELKGGTDQLGYYQVTRGLTDFRFVVGPTMPYFVFAANAVSQSIFFQALGGGGGMIAFQTTSVGFYDVTASSAITYALASGGTTSMKAAASVATFQISFADDATNSATGGELLIEGQTCTGLTSTGGNVHIKPGNGTTTYGDIMLEIPSGGLISLSAGNSYVNIDASTDDVSIGADNDIFFFGQTFNVYPALVTLWSLGSDIGTAATAATGKTLLRSSLLQTGGNTPTVIFTLTTPTDAMGTINWKLVIKTGGDYKNIVGWTRINNVSGTAACSDFTTIAGGGATLGATAVAGAQVAVTAATSTIVWTVTGIAATDIDWQLIVDADFYVS